MLLFQTLYSSFSLFTRNRAITSFLCPLLLKEIGRMFLGIEPSVLFMLSSLSTSGYISRSLPSVTSVLMIALHHGLSSLGKKKKKRKQLNQYLPLPVPVISCFSFPTRVFVSSCIFCAALPSAVSVIFVLAPQSP